MKKSLEELQSLAEELERDYQTVLNAETPYEEVTMKYAKFRAEDAASAFLKACEERNKQND